MTAAGGRHRQRPFTRRLLDLPWEDVLLPHVLSRVPLRQLLRLQRVSRAFRALVQLHLAGLRRFDAAQVSRGPKPRPVWVPPPPRLRPSPQPLCLPFRTLPGLQECGGSDPPRGKYSQRARAGCQLRRRLGSLLGGQVANPEGGLLTRKNS